MGLHRPRIIRQPGDGSCLFHSLAYGLGNLSQASLLRREIAGFIGLNPSLTIADAALQDWVYWDSSLPVSVYAARIAVGGWGGGIEMAAFARLKGVDVKVYEASNGAWRLIAAFQGNVDGKPTEKIVRVAYQGRMHYDAVVVEPDVAHGAGSTNVHINDSDIELSQELEVTCAAKSGDGSINNVGIKTSGLFQCPHCWQRFDNKNALDLHCNFTHNTNLRQEE